MKTKEKRKYEKPILVRLKVIDRKVHFKSQYCSLNQIVEMVNTERPLGLNHTEQDRISES